MDSAPTASSLVLNLLKKPAHFFCKVSSSLECIILNLKKKKKLYFLEVLDLQKNCEDSTEIPDSSRSHPYNHHHTTSARHPQDTPTVDAALDRLAEVQR